MSPGEAVTGDDDLVPLTDAELESLAVRATVSQETLPGTSPPDPRPRRDMLADANDAVMRLVGEVRRLRRREERAKAALRASLLEGPDAMRRAIGDLLDDAV
jgi:hypothetical protein